MVHELKTWPHHFAKIRQGLKTFEVRRNDRGFASGDVLVLREYSPGTDEYSGEQLTVLVTSILDGVEGAAFGIKSGFCVMSIRKLDRIRPVANLDEGAT